MTLIKTSSLSNIFFYPVIFIRPLGYLIRLNGNKIRLFINLIRQNMNKIRQFSNLFRLFMN
jgi:hypothetical protein